MTLVSTAQLYALIDSTANLLASIKIFPGFSILKAIQLLAWVGTSYLAVVRVVDRLGD